MRKPPWSDKRERQYEQLRDGLEQRGRSEDSAEEIAARTVNKERAQAGEAKEASATSTQDKSASKRAGPALARGPQGRTRDELYADAKRLGIDGRSTMDKDELERAVHRVERRGRVRERRGAAGAARVALAPVPGRAPALSRRPGRRRGLPAEVVVEFSDGAIAPALQGEDLTVGPYTTAAGTRLPAGRWEIAAAPAGASGGPEGFRVTGRRPPPPPRGRRAGGAPHRRPRRRSVSAGSG